MKWPFGTTHGPIGLDVGRASLKAVQLRNRGARARVIAVATYPRDSRDDALSVEELDQLARHLRRDGFMGRDIVLAAPATSLFTGMLDLPPQTAETPIDDIARLEVARLSRREPGSFEMAYWNLPAPARASRATHVMAVATPGTEIDPCLDLFESRGFVVQAIDVQPWALARVFRRLESDACPTPCVTVLDLGFSAARLTVILEGVVAYYRSMPDAGLDALMQALIERLDIDPNAAETLIRDCGAAFTLVSSSPEGNTSAPHSVPSRSALQPGHHVITDHFDALAEELRNAFTFIIHRYPSAKADHLHLVGGGALIPSLPRWLSDILEIPVTPLPSQSLPPNPKHDYVDTAPLWAAAVGLADRFDGGVP